MCVAGHSVLRRLWLLPVLGVAFSSCSGPESAPPDAAGETRPTAEATGGSEVADGATEPAVLPPDVRGGEDLPEPGACVVVDQSSFDSVGCSRPHTLEVAQVLEIPDDLPRQRPDDQQLLSLSLTQCAEPAAEYLGSTDMDATRLAPWTVWPSKTGWARGERWLVCGVTELDGADPVERTGSLRGALVGEPFYEFQICTEGPPSEESIRIVPCDQPHRGEAVPGTVPLGSPLDQLPDSADIDEVAGPHCAVAVENYLGVSERADVRTVRRIPTEQGWQAGHNSAVCYVETEQPVTGTLLGIGDRPLPV